MSPCFFIINRYEYVFYYSKSQPTKIEGVTFHITDSECSATESWYVCGQPGHSLGVWFHSTPIMPLQTAKPVLNSPTESPMPQNQWYKILNYGVHGFDSRWVFVIVSIQGVKTSQDLQLKIVHKVYILNGASQFDF